MPSKCICVSITTFTDQISMASKPNMNINSHLLGIVGVVVLIVIYNLLRAKKHGHKIKAKLPPEASGGLPIIGHLHLLRGPKPVPRVLGDMADKHGPVFMCRIGKHRAVVISSNEAMKECYTKHDLILASRPKTSQSKYLGYDGAIMGFAPYGRYWRYIYKFAMTELLSVQIIRKMKHVYESEINSMVNDLYLECKDNNAPVEVNIGEWLEKLLVNILTSMIAGERYFQGNKMKNEHEIRPFGQILRDYLFCLGDMVPADFVPILRWTSNFQATIRTMKRLQKEIDHIANTWVDEHEKRMKGENNSDRKDIIDILLSTIQDDSSLGYPRKIIIKATIMTFIVAGSDTTTVGLTWILSNLMNNKRCLNVVLEELDRVGRDRVVQDSDVEKLVYLRAVINETLRLYPPGAIGFPRQATEDLYIGEYFIPKGTHFISNYWKLHRNPNVWPNPHDFVPERFLTDHAKVEVNSLCYDFLPFGSGRRKCPGNNLAMQVMHLSIARLLQAFNMKTPMNMPVDMTEGLALSLPKATPLQVMLKPRLAPHLYNPNS